MKRILVSPYGFLGDTLFATSVARKLKEEGQYDVVEMLLGVPQAEPFLKLNRWIDTVWATLGMTMAPLATYNNASFERYDRVIQLQPTNKLVPPPFQFQRECGVHNPDTKFEVFTSPIIDEQVLEKYEEPYIAVMNPPSWKEKAFLFTKEQYEVAYNYPYLGYGGALRNIDWIVEELQKDFNLVMVGGESNQSARYVGKSNTLLWDASVIKYAQFFIGAEGGLANVASGVGTKTVLTSDFVWQLYGRKGVIQPFPEPKLGPRYYFPDAGHIDLNPYFTDAEVLAEYQAVLSGNKTAKDYSYDWFSTI